MTAPRRIQRFELRELLGEGGMGTVYRAHDPQLDRDVAIKVLASGAKVPTELSTVRTLDLRDSAPQREDLLAEARMMAKLSHPNVVPIYEVGLDEAGVFVVMEYVAGKDLRAWLAEPRAASDVRAVLAQAGRGLAAAHERGIVHRDFKPDNVLIGADGRARVTDFGLARLAEPATFVRTKKVAGTPRYMAPELFDGEATPASDVFAFGTTILEAVRGEENLDEATRAVVTAAIAKSPAERPTIDAVIRALEGAPRRRKPIAWIAGAAVAGLVAVVAAARSGGDGADCADPLAGRWDAEQRARVGAALGERVATILDGRATTIGTHARALCEAGRREELTAAQIAQRLGCLERRAIELRVLADVPIEQKLAAPNAEMLFERTPMPGSCDELQMATPSADPAALATLYARFQRTYKKPAAEAHPELASIAADARTAGDLELATRAAIAHASRTRQLDRAKEADAMLERAYADALALNSHDTAAGALVERIITVGNAKDMTAADALIPLARALADKPTTTPRTRFRLQQSVGRTQLIRGDTGAAIETLRTALDEAAKSGHRSADIELLARLDLADSLVVHGGEARRASIEAAKQAVELAREVNGEKSDNFGYALVLLGKAYHYNGLHADAVATRRRAVAVQMSLHDVGHSRVIEARSELAMSLAATNDLAAARKELDEVIAHAEKNQISHRSFGWILVRHADYGADLGLPEAFGEFDRALERLVSTHGPEHPLSVGQRTEYAMELLEAGRLDDAARVARLVTESVARSLRGPRDPRPAQLRGALDAGLALARGDAAAAEALARRALGELVELAVPDEEKTGTRLALARALVAQRRYTDARPYVEAGLATLRAAGARADELAAFEAVLARIELGLGNRTEALALADAIRERIAPFAAQSVRADLAKIK